MFFIGVVLLITWYFVTVQGGNNDEHIITLRLITLFILWEEA